MVDFSLHGKVAIVTGAAGGGIGEAYARALAGAGAAVVCADIDAAGAAAAADAVVAAGGKAIPVEVDITDEASVDEMVRQTVSELGGVDILVNNAALMAQIARPDVTTFPRELWDQAFAVNVTGAWLCARAAVPEMQRRGGGSIVNQASIGALPAESVYGVTKLAIVGLTTALARELGPADINVNCIAPGMTNSAAGKISSSSPGGAAFNEAMRSRVAMQARGTARGEPDDLCGALLLLVSPAGHWMTGQVLVVDGGIVLHT